MTTPMGEPAPVGVVQANFSQGGPTMMPGAAAAYAPQAMPPGRAVAESSPGPRPVSGQERHVPPPARPRSPASAGRAWARRRRRPRPVKKAEAHAMISYDEERRPAPVDEIPASMVFDKKQR